MSEVEAAWKREQRAAVAERKTAELIDELKGGKSLQSIAKQMSGTLRKTKPFYRTGQGLEMAIPEQMVQNLFSAKERVALSSPGNGAHFIARVREIKAAGPLTGEQGVDAIRRQIDGYWQGSDGWVVMHFKRGINQEAVNAYFKVGNQAQ